MFSSPAPLLNEVTRWLIAIALSGVFFLGALGYIGIGYPNVSVLEMFSFAAAAVSSLLLACALSIGSLHHFCGWPDIRWGLQKQIGIVAFWWALGYTLTLPVLYPELYWSGLPYHFTSVDVVAGLSALIIFAAMVVVPSSAVAPFVTKPTVGFILGLGYVGYALLVIRAIFIEWDLWLAWFSAPEGLPPGRLFLSLIALLVLALRVAVAVDRHRSTARTPVA